MDESGYSRPEVSFIIIDYYSLSDVYNCIKSIKSNASDIKYEIIVSSNSCYNEKDKKNILNSCPDVKWVFNNSNRGFGSGMNQGMKNAIGKYYIFLNPDVIIVDGLKKMINFLDNNKLVGAIGPKIIDKNGLLQDSCRNYVTLFRFIIRQLYRLFMNKRIIYEKNINYNLIQTVDWLSGAFLMVRSELINKLNGFDEKYFLYAEDLDLCTRIRLNGFEIVYFPEATIVFSGSRNARHNFIYAYIFMKSHLRFWLKFGFFCGYPRKTDMFTKLCHLNIL